MCVFKKWISRTQRKRERGTVIKVTICQQQKIYSSSYREEGEKREENFKYFMNIKFLILCDSNAAAIKMCKS